MNIYDNINHDHIERLSMYVVEFYTQTIFRAHLEK
jgi:hypothetical protein